MAGGCGHTMLEISIFGGAGGLAGVAAFF